MKMALTVHLQSDTLSVNWLPIQFIAIFSLSAYFCTTTMEITTNINNNFYKPYKNTKNTKQKNKKKK